MLLGWLEKFVARNSLVPGREACARFWRKQVIAKPRDPWQIDQWGAVIRWYLRWLEHRYAKGGEVRSLPERVRDAVRRRLAAMRGQVRGGAMRCDFEDRVARKLIRSVLCWMMPRSGVLKMRGRNSPEFSGPRSGESRNRPQGRHFAHHRAE